jgi:hypothetical protein
MHTIRIMSRKICGKIKKNQPLGRGFYVRAKILDKMRIELIRKTKEISMTVLIFVFMLVLALPCGLQAQSWRLQALEQRVYELEQEKAIDEAMRVMWERDREDRIKPTVKSGRLPLIKPWAPIEPEDD